MAIQLKDLKPKNLAAIERDVDYKGLVKLKMRVSQNKAFANAMSKIYEQGNNKKVTKDALAKDNFDENELSMGEAILYLIGEYLVTEWDVEAAGEVAPINGDNFTTLCASIGDADENIEFTAHIFENYRALMDEFSAQTVETKKKPSVSGNGRKKTAS